MKVTLEMSADDLKVLRAFLIISLDKGVVSKVQDVWDIVSSAANQLDKQLYPPPVALAPLHSQYVNCPLPTKPHREQVWCDICHCWVDRKDDE